MDKPHRSPHSFEHIPDGPMLELREALVADDLAAVARLALVFGAELRAGMRESVDRDYVPTLARAEAEDDYQCFLEPPLHIAIRKGDLAAARILMPHADCNARSSSGDTPLHYAAKGNKLELARELLRYAHPDLRDAFGHAPLHCAVRLGFADMAALLAPASDLEASAPPALGMAPETAMEMARRFGKASVVAAIEPVELARLQSKVLDEAAAAGRFPLGARSSRSL